MTKVRFGPEPFFYPNGQPAPGVAVTVYAAGTTTRIPLYTDSTGTVPLANPLVTDSQGFITFYADPGYYTMSANGELFAIHIPGPLILPPVYLVDAPVIVVDASAGSALRVTLGGNRTLAKPTGGVDGQMLMFEITQDSVGSRTITLATGYNFGTDLTVITLSLGAQVTDYLLVKYVSARDEWDVIGLKKGF